MANKPHFIGIGAQKAGTTWLFENLKRQKGFSMPEIKGFHYFDRCSRYPSPDTLKETWLWHRIKDPSYRRITAFRLNNALKNGDPASFFWWANYHLRNYNDNWYLSLFKHARGITGDITPSYAILEDHDVASLERLLPDIKILMMIRNPIDRAWSHYRFSQRKKPSRDFMDMNHFRKFVRSPAQVLRSDYEKTIKKFAYHFPSNQILVCFYDAIIHDPEGLLIEILRFLGSEQPLVKSELLSVFNLTDTFQIPNTLFEILQETYGDAVVRMSEQWGSYAKDWGKNSGKTNRR
jgi:hypothetical protein